MKIRYMPDALLAHMKNNLSNNIERYSMPDVWVDDYAKENDLPGLYDLDITIKEDLLDLSNYKNDFLVSKNIYLAFKQVNPVQASDERLWAGLSHTEPFYSYTQKRWLKNNKESMLKRRFFLESKGIGGLSRNSISRLWWFGYLTYDESQNDPFEYTEKLLKYQDTPVGLLERSLGKNPRIVKIVASYISEHGKNWKNISKSIQILIRNLNLAGGAVLLDSLTDDDLTELLNNCSP